MSTGGLTAKPGATVSGDGRLILIAERDKTVRELQSQFLVAAGYTVEFVDDGQAALDRARVAAPALLITEILIPKMDGLTVCRALRDDPATRDIPVMVFSILSASTRADAAGATSFLRKPFIQSVFLATVEHSIGARTGNSLEHV